MRVHVHMRVRVRLCAVATPAPAPPAAVTAEEVSRWVAAALVAVWLFYLAVFHFLSNMPLDQPLLFGVQARWDAVGRARVGKGLFFLRGAFCVHLLCVCLAL